MAALHHQAFETGQHWSESAFADLLAAPTTLAAGIEGKFGLIALVVIQKIDPDAEILTLCVAPTAKRSGHGRALIHGVSQILAQYGIARLMLDVAADNAAALGFYDNLGFTRDGLRKAYYHRAETAAIDAILMSRATVWTDRA